MVMENWNEKLIKALQLNGKSGRTQANYIRTVRILTEHCNKTPDLITEEELQEYCLYRRNVSKWAPNTMKSCYAGCRFFFENVLSERIGSGRKAGGRMQKFFLSL
jgi:integrase/recombinase XerD